MKNKTNNSRRHFLKTALKGSALAGLGIASLSDLMAEPARKINIPTKTGFQQQPLPYSYTALEPVIDAQTMELHYSKHAAAYAKNLNDAAAAEKVDTSQSLEDILPSISRYSMKIRNNGGGHYNHELFWKLMRSPRENNMPAEKFMNVIGQHFKSFDDFKKEFTEAAKSRFGSGWAWLYADKNKKLLIGSTPNQDNPLMDVSDIKGTPLLGLDVWEHAYYLKYQNRRAEYIENWWKLVNWDLVQAQYESLG